MPVNGTSNNTLSSPIIPREHGAWAVLFIPMLVAVLRTHVLSFSFIAFLFSSLGLFMTYDPAQQILKQLRAGHTHTIERKQRAKLWFTIYAIGSILLFIPLLLGGYYWLLPLAGIGIIAFFLNYFITRIFGKTPISDLISISGLSLSGLGAYYVLTGIIDRNGIMIWLLNLFFFGSNVFYVHIKIIAATIKTPMVYYRDKFLIGRYSIWYNLFILTLLGYFIWQRLVSALSILPFIPISLHVCYGIMKMSPKVNFKNLGYLLVGQSILFGLILGMLVP
ncbi:MAG: YwiC-like family protein [Bacteroidota bacterium]